MSANDSESYQTSNFGVAKLKQIILEEEEAAREAYKGPRILVAEDLILDVIKLQEFAYDMGI